MDYEYTSIGGIAFSGIATCRWHKFAILDYAYTLFGAKQGILEKICIKSIFFNPDDTEIVTVYKDTFNTLWIEYELFTLEEAEDYINEHTIT